MKLNLKRLQELVSELKELERIYTNDTPMAIMVNALERIKQLETEIMTMLKETF